LRSPRGNYFKIAATTLFLVVQLLVPAQASQASQAIADSQGTASSAFVAYKTANEASYSLAEVAVHNTQSNCWTVVFEKVYNITTYIKNHPGGANSISKICGKDGTSIFDNKHGGSSSVALILSTYKIGVLAKPVVRTCTAGNFFSVALSQCTPAPKGYFVSATSAAAGVTSATACPAGKFSSGPGAVECQAAPKGFFVSTSASSSATQCSAGFTTLVSGSTMASDCYKPLAQTIPGFNSPKVLKYKAVSYLLITTNTNANATAKATGPCTAQAVNLVTTVKGQKVTTRKLKVTASTKAGNCKITLTSPAKDKYLGMTKTVQIKVSKTGK
jgi:cytochrome b involved in lipid metabolism